MKSIEELSNQYSFVFITSEVGTEHSPFDRKCPSWTRELQASWDISLHEARALVGSQGMGPPEPILLTYSNASFLSLPPTSRPRLPKIPFPAPSPSRNLPRTSQTLPNHIIDLTKPTTSQNPHSYNPGKQPSRTSPQQTSSILPTSPAVTQHGQPPHRPTSTAQQQSKPSSKQAPKFKTPPKGSITVEL